jgi:hypothetical protein
MRALHRLRDLGLRLPGIHQLVERHGHVRAEQRLDLHGTLRREPMRRAVEVGGEGDTVVIDSSQIRQREDLEPARIGQDRPVPAHEPMQPAEPRDPFRRRPQVEVVGVPQDHLRAGGVQVARSQRLHRGLGADRHELGRVNRAVRCDNAPQPGSPDRRRLEGGCDHGPR